MIIAQLLVKYKSYFYCLIFLGIISILTILLSVYLYYINKAYYKKRLNLVNYEDEISGNAKMNIEIPNIDKNKKKNYTELEEEEV